jgi:hypothetical protein
MKKFLQYNFLFLSIFSCNIFSAQESDNDKADLIVFSYDRPMQLEAFLRSTKKLVKNLGDVSIIYRTSSERFNNAYLLCFSSFIDWKNLRLIKQGENASQDFKQLLIQCLKNTKHKYLMFAVDDIIVKDNFDVADCIKQIEKNNACGFYLRLGKNISECYTEGIQTPMPEHKEVDKGVYQFGFRHGKGDWGYPFSVDMTIYEKGKILPAICKHNYTNPNWLESALHINEWFYNQDKTHKGLCYETSKIVNIPLNIVQKDVVSRNMGVSNQDLLEKFEQGMRINIDQLFRINNKAPHIEFNINFMNQFPFNDLWNACHEQDMQKIEQLKQEYPDFIKNSGSDILNLKDQNGYTSLMWAANGQDLEAVKFLIENGADINAGDKNNFNALMYACWRGNAEIVEYMIKNKADRDAIDINGTTALSMADKSDSPDKDKIITLLIED